MILPFQLVAGLLLALACLPLMYCALCHRNPLIQQAAFVGLLLWGSWLTIMSIVGRPYHPALLLATTIAGLLITYNGHRLRDYLLRH